MNRFKLLQDFAKFAQRRYDAEDKGTRVFTEEVKDIEDEKYEILLFMKLMIRETLRDNPDLDKLEKKVKFNI